MTSLIKSEPYAVMTNLQLQLLHIVIIFTLISLTYAAAEGSGQGPNDGNSCAPQHEVYDPVVCEDDGMFSRSLACGLYAASI